MKNKVSFITDFWVCWGKLAQLNYPKNDKSNNQKVIWAIWHEESFLRRYNGKLFGIELNVDKRKRERKEEQKSKHAENDEPLPIWIEKEIPEWQIWSQKIDLDQNLQCLSWTQTFWFYWLIDWMSNNSSCPNWRWELDQSKIRPNIDIKRQIKQIKEKQAYPICNEHKKNWKFYWLNCCTFICSKCIVSDKQANHKFIDSKDEISRIHEKVNYEL